MSWPRTPARPLWEAVSSFAPIKRPIPWVPTTSAHFCRPKDYTTSPAVSSLSNCPVLQQKALPGDHAAFALRSTSYPLQRPTPSSPVSPDYHRLQAVQVSLSCKAGAGADAYHSVRYNCPQWNPEVVDTALRYQPAALPLQSSIGCIKFVSPLKACPWAVQMMVLTGSPPMPTGSSPGSLWSADTPTWIQTAIGKLRSCVFHHLSC